jgi:acyl dehydratase
MTEEATVPTSAPVPAIGGLDASGLPAVGTAVTFSKTVGESDVYLMAGITGDFSPNHVNEEYMKGTRYGRRIAHGVLCVGYMSTCSTKMIELMANRPTVSYGYDRIRFIKPVFIGDTLTVDYRIAERDETKGELRAQVSVTNQHGDLVAVAVHILKLA